VYSLRIPSVQHDQFYKFRRGDADNINFQIKKNSVLVSTTPVNLFPDQITDSFADIGTTIRTVTITDAAIEVMERRLSDK